MRIHIPAIPHTVTDRKRYNSCAFTCKVEKLCRMLTNLGHEVFHYGCEGAKVRATEVVDVVSDTLRMATYPDQDDHTKQYQFDTEDDYHRVFYRNAISAIRQRMGDRDILMCPWGTGHRPIAEAFPEMIVVESGIGYPHTFAPFRVFESYFWMSHLYGHENFNGDGNWYDAVIPNAFDVDDFEYREDKDDFFLYLGRLVKRKGVEVAVDVTGRIGAKLVIAGHGRMVDEEEGIDLRADHVEFVGYADAGMRRDLMSRARGVFVPTYYLEPFGGVMIEAALSGSPCIATDWGAATENILHGLTGYRCRTFEQFCWAAENIGNIRPNDCRNWAVDNFSLGAVTPLYSEYLNGLRNLFEDGWYHPNPGRTDLDWLRRKYPRR